MVMRIPLTNGLYALVDDADYPLVSQWEWSCRARKGKRTQYVLRHYRENNQTKTAYLHRVILNAPPGTAVDHKSGDGLDNTRANLRLATLSENNRNISKPRHGISSRYKGVNWDRQSKKFRAQISFDKQRKWLGRFDSEVDAAWAYDREARSLHGGFANCNFPPPPAIIPEAKQ